MLDIKIIREVQIAAITEEWIEQVVRKELASQLPAGIIIDKLEFVRKLNPTRTEIEVTAKFEDEPVRNEPAKTEAVVEATAEAEPEEQTEEVEKSAGAVSNIFANLTAG